MPCIHIMQSRRSRARRLHDQNVRQTVVCMHAYADWDRGVCTYSASCVPAGHAEELRQVLQVIGPGVIHDAGAMAVRILVAIELVNGALGRTAGG
jgi:hypothetical protein